MNTKANQKAYIARLGRRENVHTHIRRSRVTVRSLRNTRTGCQNRYIGRSELSDNWRGVGVLYFMIGSSIIMGT